MCTNNNNILSVIGLVVNQLVSLTGIPDFETSNHNLKIEAIPDFRSTLRVRFGITEDFNFLKNSSLFCDLTRVRLRF